LVLLFGKISDVFCWLMLSPFLAVTACRFMMLVVVGAAVLESTHEGHCRT
jgi:hypothetical protein